MRGVIFDLYGTLVQAAPATARAALLARHGVSPEQPAHAWLLRGLVSALLIEDCGLPFEVGRDLALVRPFAGVRELAAALALRTGRAARASVVSRTEALYEELHALDGLMPGAHALLAALAAAGVPTALLSNCDWSGALALRRHGLDRLVDTVVLSCDAGRRKPDPRLFAAVMERLGTAPRETIVVGDSFASDVVGAVSAGARAIWLNDDAATAGQRARLGAGPTVVWRDRWGAPRWIAGDIRCCGTLDEVGRLLLEPGGTWA